MSDFGKRPTSAIGGPEVTGHTKFPDASCTFCTRRETPTTRIRSNNPARILVVYMCASCSNEVAWQLDSLGEQR